MIVDEVLAMYGIRDQMDEAAEEPLNFETPWQSPQVPVVGTARQGMAESDTAS